MSICSRACSFGSIAWSCVSRRVGKLLSAVDDKTVKVVSSVTHMWNSAKARNYTEFGLGALSLVRGAANTAVGVAYTQLLANGASISEVFRGDVSLTSAAVAFAAIGLLSNGLLESASAIKSLVLKPQNVDENSLAIQRIMNKSFFEKIKRLSLSPEAEGHIRWILNAQVATSAVFALAFATVATLSVGSLITPQGILIAVTTSTVGKMVRYQVFNKFLRNSLAEVQTEKQERAATIFDGDDMDSAAVESQEPRLVRSLTDVARNPQRGHYSTLMRNPGLASQDPSSFGEFSGEMVLVDVHGPVRAASVPLQSVFLSEASQGEDLAALAGLADSDPVSVAENDGARMSNASPISLVVDSTGTDHRENAGSPAPSDVSLAPGSQFTLRDVARFYSSEDDDAASRAS